MTWRAIRTELWHPARSWRGNVAQWLLYFQAFNSAIAIVAAVAGVSAWLKLFGVSTEHSLLVGCVFVPVGVVGGVFWKHYGIWRESQEAGLVAQINEPQVMQWKLDVALAKKMGVDVHAAFAGELPAEVEHFLQSKKAEG